MLAQVEISNETTFEYEPEFDDDMDEYLGAPPNILSSLPECIYVDDFRKYSDDPLEEMYLFEFYLVSQKSDSKKLYKYDVGKSEKTWDRIYIYQKNKVVVRKKY